MADQFILIPALTAASFKLKIKLYSVFSIFSLTAILVFFIIKGKISAPNDNKIFLY